MYPEYWNLKLIPKIKECTLISKKHAQSTNWQQLLSRAPTVQNLRTSMSLNTKRFDDRNQSHLRRGGRACRANFPSSHLKIIFSSYYSSILSFSVFFKFFGAVVRSLGIQKSFHFRSEFITKDIRNVNDEVCVEKNL